MKGTIGMKKLLWFNASASALFLLICLAVYGWWHFIAPQPFLKQLPQETIESAQAITDLDRLRKLNLLLVEKDRTNITQMNALIETSLDAFLSLAQLSFILFLIGSVWLYQLPRNRPPPENAGDRSSNPPLNTDARQEAPRAG